MDLSTLDTVAGSEAGFELELCRPDTQEPVGVYITVLGRDSERFRKTQAEHNRRRMAKMQKSGTLRVNLTSEELERETIELLVACTVSWRTEDERGERDTSKPVIRIKGEELDCTPENAARLYRQWPWVKEQVDQAVVDRANFLKR